MKPKHLDLFSGIGGFALGAQAVGFETIGFSEIDPYASAVLKKHWPDIPNYGDVRTVPAVGCDLITGGFPCQPFSCAGKRRGAADDRFLWPAMLDVIQRCRPAWVLGENVAGLIDMELDRCFADLENAGYEVQPLIIPACAVDARHRRYRVWIVAHRDQIGLDERGPCANYIQRERQTKIEVEIGNKRECDASGTCETVSNTKKEQRDRGGKPWHRGGQPANCGGEDRGAVADTNCSGGGQRMAGPDGSKKGQTRILDNESSAGDGLQDGRATAVWPVEPGLGRVADGIPNRVDRLKGLGNAIVPQVAEVILREIIKHL